MTFDGKAFGAEVVVVVREHLAREIAPLRAENEGLRRRVEALEARQPERGEKGEPGQRGEAGSDGVGVAGAMIDRSGVLILTLSDGRTQELGAVVGKDGRDGVDGAPGTDGERGEDGASPDMDAIAETVRTMVEEAVAALPPAPRGEKGEAGERGETGAVGAPGADGVGVMGAAIDRDGELFLTLTDGSIRGLGPVLGSDGAPGANGRDGVDGFGFDDLQFDHDGERGFTLRFVKGERVKEFAFSVPVPIDRGVWREGTYQKGDFVTWGGSGWFAQRETTAKPDCADGSWRLAIKKGRDGKDKA